MSEYLTQHADFHMHTTFCDGKSTPEEMVKSAIEKGLTVVGISGHAPLPLQIEDTSSMTEAGVLAYRAEIAALKEKYKDQITVLCGIEQDYFSHLPTTEYDYVIGSVHEILVNGKYFAVDAKPEKLKSCIDTEYGGDIYAMCEDYYALVGDIVNRTHCQIVGHFDLVTKFIEKGLPFDTSHPRYVKAWKAAADQLLAAGVLFEVNTGAISRGWRTAPYPATDILEYLVDNGGKAILTSDSHHADNVAYVFDRAYAHAKTAGMPLVREFCGVAF